MGFEFHGVRSAMDEEKFQLHLSSLQVNVAVHFGVIFRVKLVSQFPLGVPQERAQFLRVWRVWLPSMLTSSQFRPRSQIITRY
jgi:hypothetical protein